MGSGRIDPATRTPVAVARGEVLVYPGEAAASV